MMRSRARARGASAGLIFSFQIREDEMEMKTIARERSVDEKNSFDLTRARSRTQSNVHRIK